MAISLASIKRSGKPKPPVVMMYAVHGIGKTTFGASAPKPIFIQTEDGLGAIETDTFGILKTFDELMDAIGSLYNDQHDFKSVIVDSLDWAEPIIHAETARINGWKSIDDGSKETSFQRGYKAAADTWKILLEGLTALRDERDMAVIMLAHSEIKRFESPEADAFDRYQPKLHKDASAIIQEACDDVLFANYRVNTVKTDVGFNRKVVRGVGSGERLIHTVERPAFLAKNRWSLPESLLLSWDSYASGIPYYASRQTAIAAE
jgi:hypothetical protein